METAKPSFPTWKFQQTNLQKLSICKFKIDKNKSLLSFSMSKSWCICSIEIFMQEISLVHKIFTPKIEQIIVQILKDETLANWSSKAFHHLRLPLYS